MRPRVTLHMMSSIDGRIATAGWPISVDAGEAYEMLHRDLRSDAWLVGRTTMAAFADGEARPVVTDQSYPRQTWKAAGAGMAPYAIYLDRSGHLHLNRERVNGDALIAVLTTAVSDHYLAELRRDGISYIFAGEADLDLSRALHILRTEFGIETLLLEGGGAINGAFLGGDLIDEVSLLILPIADGKPDVPTTFDDNLEGARPLDFISAENLDGGILHLRYRVLSGRPGTST
ncbi:bifunctional deaminase-reductase domain protein [Rhizobium sp. CF080]|uniref:dihydrofolate reductase family protein n=1 Tax=Rhizobium sp. (strain CF080) TaxID=1144310 RepID=UPI000271BCD7|nr:RibD family protein [Rhizobium sp. CF080]EUB99225.1 bifunctional deaminase-reductase domain protein [Rhizobium sp. CF080]